MKFSFAYVIISLFFCFHLEAQTPLNKAVADAYLITRMAEKFHVQPKPLDDAFSANIFNLLLTKLDEERIYFNQQDITVLQAYKFQLDDEIKNKKYAFLKQLTTFYRQRIQQLDTMIDNICKTPFNFTIKEQLSVAEDSNFASNPSTQRLKIYKLLKLSSVQYIAGYLATAKSTINQKKYLDSIEPIIRKKIQNVVKRPIKKLLQTPTDIDVEVGNSYCEAVAECYDPHTEYFPPRTKENFESELGKKPLRFGFTLDEDQDGKILVSNLIPGSSAYKSGQLNKGDKILSVQWDGQQKIDVTDKDVAIINDLFERNTQDKMTLTVKKADGSTRQVILQKKQIDNGEDDDRVKSFILKGTKSIGYISLPAFYEDWEDQSRGVNGCANDVAKEILKLKKENISGLIIDVRYNGGGSLSEAVDLAGLFIDAGPVAQIKDKSGKIYTLKDGNRGTIFDGPLAVMINGYSASASEMLAGTLQDYNRALIVGTPTYGKATAQVILPMDTTINIDENNQNKKADSYIKMTISRLYRVNGSTAQASGVLPDILLPDLLSARAKREADNPLALVVQPIEPNKYYKPNPQFYLTDIKALAANEINTSQAFMDIKKRVEQINLAKQKVDISLLLSDAIQLRKSRLTIENDDDEEADTQPVKNLALPSFTIANHAFETKRLEADSSQKEMNEGWKSFLMLDSYIKTVYKLMLLMK